MMRRSKLRDRQQKMFAKHHPRERQGEYQRRDADAQSRFRIFTMFAKGYSDEFVAKATGLSVPGVTLYREAVYLHYLRTQNRKRGEKCSDGLCGDEARSVPSLQK